MSYAIKLSDLLEKARELRSPHIVLDDTQLQGVNSIINSIEKGGMSIGVGPPGTGKTVIFNIAQKEVFERLDDDEIIVYIAPTNRLVEECAVRTLKYMLEKGLSEADLKNLVRVYGSRFKAEPLEKEIKVVFTTPYQPGALKSLHSMKNSLHLMVDEASTTPLHGPFIELAMSMVNIIREKRLDWFHSFSIIGDPMQAIVEGYKLQEKFRLLIVGRILMEAIPQSERSLVREDPSVIFKLAKSHLPSLGIGYFFLENTYRIPKPTEYLVSIPFYSSMLKGVEDYKQRLSGVKRESPGTKSKVLDRCKLIRNTIRDALDNALDSCIPVVYFRDRGQAYKGKAGRRPPEIEELDVLRARISYEIAAYLLASTADPIRVEVLTPYVEMKTQMQLGLRQLVGEELKQELDRRVKISTVHSALGSEADIVIVTMGKEYRGEGISETIYFQTPELINVQFSRHRRLLVIIGNVEALVRNFEKVKHAKNVSRLREALNELRQQGLVTEANIDGKKANSTLIFR